MASGIKVSEKVRETYEIVKMNTSHKRQYAVFKLSDDKKQIVVDVVSDKSECKSESKENGRADHFQKVIRNLPTDDARYLLFDYEYEGKHGPSSKLVLVMWCPEGISIHTKMLYASSKDALKKICKDLGADLQADCIEDLTANDIEGKLKK